VLYEAYPLAPPRLTRGLEYDGHPFRFVDTLYQVLNANGHVAGTKIGFNEFAAMPSLHIGWAIIVGMTLAWALRSPVLRLLALVYPLVMLVAVVVTGNHYLMDAVGAVGCLIGAVVLASLYAWLRSGRRSPAVLYRQFRRMRYGSPARSAEAPVRGRTPLTV
jgi:membrane-associated phospholipid phosphatase